jgi:DNA polymerase-3 subunit gamma/tau
MVTSQGFNALLKTLEEPPPHAKFVFATTEIRKVPVTVLSRCQRFDLRRVDADALVGHLEGIAAKEGITAESEALALIARAAEGSVRDSLSLLDQAIAHAAGAIRAEDVRRMLGLADRTRIIDLFEALMKGDIAAALTELRGQYDAGADPAVVLTDLAEFTHLVTRVKIVPAVAEDRSLAEVERMRARTFAAGLSMRVLSRTWQMLFKGLPEVQSAPKAIAAAEMVLVRIAYAADLPTPDEALRVLADNGGAETRSSPSGGGAPSGGAAARFDAPRSGGARAPLQAAAAPANSQPVARRAEAEPKAPALAIGRFEDLVALADERRDLQMKSALERDVGLVRFEDGRLEITLEPAAPKTLVNELSRKLGLWTGRPWMVVVSSQPGQPTLRAQDDARRAEMELGIQGDPLVKTVLARFPGAQIVAVRDSDPGPVVARPATDDAVGDDAIDDGAFAEPDDEL